MDKIRLLQVVLIILAGTWIYWPVLHGDWLWDDTTDVTENTNLRTISGLWSIWFQPGNQIDYYPIKSSVQWLQWHLWGNDPFGYHVTNLVLHVMSALLIWRLFERLGIRFAWLGGLLFTIHPMMVESVAWIAELKNTLSLPLFIGAMLCYLNYDAKGQRRDYLFSLGLFLLAMLCKPTMVAFPVVILLLAWWKRQRIEWKDVKASIPFFIVSLELGINTIFIGAAFRRHAHLIQDAVPLGGFFSHAAMCGLSLAFYFAKAIWPFDLMPMYPQWPVNPPSLIQFLPWPILFAVLYFLWTKREGWGRHALFGLGFFGITLAPFITVNVGLFATFTWVMDHMLYIPIIGLIGLVVAAIGQITGQLNYSLRIAGALILAVILTVLAGRSRSYATEFINMETLWTYTLQRNPQAAFAHDYLAMILIARGQDVEGIEHLNEAIRLRPDYLEAYNDLGTTLLHEGRLPEAIAEFEAALTAYPNNAETHNNLGKALMQSNRLAEAGQQFVEVIRLKPDEAVSYINPGNLLMQMGRIPEAIQLYQRAIELDPDNAQIHYNLASALLQMGNGQDALNQFLIALQLNPSLAGAHQNMGVILAEMGRLPEAQEQFEDALQINPNYVSAHDNLGRVFEDMKRIPEATAQYKEALRLKPDDTWALSGIDRLKDVKPAMHEEAK